jgi:hypothetical protein
VVPPGESMHDHGLGATAFASFSSDSPLLIVADQAGDLDARDVVAAGRDAVDARA